MKKAALIFAILLFSNYNIFSQVISRPMQGLTPDELSKSYIIPQLITDPYQKVMACATAANDNFANAIALTVNGGTVSGSTCGTFQAGEAYGCNTAGDPTVWYKFVATATTLYVQIDGLTGSCYFGSAIYQTNTMPTAN